MRNGIVALSIALLPSSLLAQARPLIRGAVISEQTLGVKLARIGSLSLGPSGYLAAVLFPGPQIAIVRGADRPIVFSRDGSGPGELRSPSAIGWIDDNLWVGDGVLGRVTLFTSSGTLVRSIPAPGSMMGGPVLLRDGHVALVPLARATVEQQRPAPERVLRVSAGKVSDTLLTLMTQHRAFSVTMPQGHMVGEQAFDDFPLLRAFPNGSGFVVVKRPIGRGKSAEYSVQRFAVTGQLLFQRSFWFTPVPLAKQDVDAVVAKVVTDMGGSADPGLPARIEAALFRPSYFPPVNAVVPGQDGTLWIQRERTTTALGKWTLLSAKGSPVGDFLLPTTLQVRAGTATAVWGVETDADGVPSIVEYRVPR